LGYILLGEIVSKIKGENLSESFKRILNEAGLISTGFHSPDQELS
jgi:hypothetical protein